MKIMGIDPGFDRLGFAFIEKNPGQKEVILNSGTITTDKKETHPKRFSYIRSELVKILEKEKPDIVGVESILFSNNQKTAVLVSGVRGVILEVLGSYDFDVIEVNPKTVKLSVTGSGSSDKKAILKILPKIIAFPEKKMLDDEVDAIAIALTTSTLSTFPQKA
ncbi:MAG: crossover junction endodeoxyribonuclease RuvC [Candidatus Nomurabacteria bacterium]|nr:MAG: crossover junction endodeoxyribonuclease RuvC [Candidatus Nomurabacteria bacterium]